MITLNDSNYGFERVSPEQFMKDFTNLINTTTANAFGIKEVIDLHTISANYDNIIRLPERGTKNSAGYDFFLPSIFEIKLNESNTNKPLVIPTGIKCKLPNDCFLGIYPRSSFGIKKGIYLANTVGIIDTDYYNNLDNEGHIMVALNARYIDDNTVINGGEKFVQGLVQPYLTFGDNVSFERKGGVGSTTLPSRD
jgi:dUTP pyrophosphatase